MPYRQLIEAHHRTTYSDNVMMVAQQLRNPLRMATTVITGITGEAHAVADLVGAKDYIVGEDYSHRNPDNKSPRRRRLIMRPPVIEDGEYIETAQKFDMAMDPTAPLMRNSIATCERGVFDTILGVEKQSNGKFAPGTSGIFGKAAEGKRGETIVSLPAANYIPANASGLTLDKLRAVILALNTDEFGLEDDDPLHAAITPKQKDDLLAIAQATNQSLNPFMVEQLRSGKPTELMGITWHVTNRLPVDSSGNRLVPVWSKKNIVTGFWQDVEGDMWNDTNAKNLPYIYTSVYVDAVRIQDGGVRVIRCQE